MADKIMFYGGMISAILFGIGAIILFLVLRIHAVIGELSGITAKRSIRRLQKEGYGEHSKKRSIRENTDQIVARRGKTTGKLKTGRENDETTTLLYQKKQIEQTTVLQKPQFLFEVVEEVMVTHSDVEVNENEEESEGIV